MGTYDTIGGTPISPPYEPCICEVCGKDADAWGEPGGCDCKPSPVCGTVCDPDCAISGGTSCAPRLYPKKCWKYGEVVER